MIVLVHEVAILAKKSGILDENKYREYCIYEEYIKLKSNRVKNIVYKLSEKHNLSQERIYKIIKKQEELRND